MPFVITELTLTEAVEVIDDFISITIKFKFMIFTAQCTLVHMRGLGIACRPSVRLSVCPSVCDVGGL